MHLDNLLKVTEFFSGIQSQDKDLCGSISVDTKLVTSKADCISKDELDSAAVMCIPQNHSVLKSQRFLSHVCCISILDQLQACTLLP